MRQIGQDMAEHPKTVQSLVLACLHMRQTEDRWKKGKAHKLEENMGEKELGKQQHKADTQDLETLKDRDNEKHSQENNSKTRRIQIPWWGGVVGVTL